MPLWALLTPLVASALLAVAVVLSVGVVLASVCALALMGAVFAAVHHAKVVTHRVGEPFGTWALGVEEQRVNVLIDITSPPAEWAALGDGYRVGVRIVTRSMAGVVRG